MTIFILILKGRFVRFINNKLYFRVNDLAKKSRCPNLCLKLSCFQAGLFTYFEYKIEFA